MTIARVALLAGLCGIAGCGRQAAQPQQPARTAPQVQSDDAPLDTVHGFMTKRVDPYADIIWGIGNAAMNDEAGIDPAKVSPEGWRTMESTAAKLRDAAAALGKLQPIRVVHPGERVVDEGRPLAPTAARSQKAIDADPAAFRDMAAALEQHGRDLAVAARAHDAPTAARLINEFDEVCESCHLQFWYPDDRKIIETLISKRKAAAAANRQPL